MILPFAFGAVVAQPGATGVAAFGRKPPFEKYSRQFAALCRDAATPPSPRRLAENSRGWIGRTHLRKTECVRWRFLLHGGG